MNNCLDSLRKHLKHSPGDGMLAVTDRLLNLDHNWQYDPVQCEQVKDFIKTNVQFDIK